MSPCLSPSDILRHNVSFSSWLIVCLPLIHFVILTHCLSPFDQLRHRGSLSFSSSVTSSWLIVCLPLIFWPYVCCLICSPPTTPPFPPSTPSDAFYHVIMSLCFPQSASLIQECLSPSDPLRRHDLLSLSGPLRHHDSLCLTHYLRLNHHVIMSLCLPLMYYIMMSPCLSPSNVLHHNVSLSVSLWCITS